jgi:hypothetical protein
VARVVIAKSLERICFRLLAIDAGLEQLRRIVSSRGGIAPDLFASLRGRAPLERLINRRVEGSDVRRRLPDPLALAPDNDSDDDHRYDGEDEENRENVFACRHAASPQPSRVNSAPTDSSDRSGWTRIPRIKRVDVDEPNELSDTFAPAERIRFAPIV